MENKKLIENEKRRNRLDSVPIITGMGAEEPRELDRKRMRDEEKKNEEKVDDSKSNTGSPVSKLNEGINSPDAKKLRNDEGLQTINLNGQEPEKKKMEVIQEMKNDLEEVVVDTKIISKLIENIDEEKVKTLIECFNPAIRNNPEYIKEQMIECSTEWDNKTNIFIGAINYIVHNSQTDGYNLEQMKDIETERLSEILTREIENRMPTFCGKCQAWYIVGFGDQPEMHCMWCRVGIHDCERMNETSKYPGMKWLCVKCEPNFQTHFLPKLDQFSLFSGFFMNKTKSKTKIKPKNDETIHNETEVTVEAEVIEVMDSDSKEENETQNDNNKEENNKAKNVNKDDNSENSTNNNNNNNVQQVIPK